MNRWKKIWGNQNCAIRTALILMFLGGLLMSFLIPAGQTPDEPAQLYIIGYGIGQDGLNKTLYSDLSLDWNRLVFHYEEKMELSAWKEAMTRAPGYEKNAILPQGVHLYLIRHLPATVGIVLGGLLGLPTFWVLQLGELMALIFYVAMCGLALKIMPVHKELLLMFMTFPMTLQQAASLNHDNVLLPACFLYVAYIFYMRCEKVRLGWRDVFATLFLFGVIAYMKVPYLFLGLLVFLLPKEKIHLKVFRWEINGAFIKKWRIPLLVVLLAAGAAGIYLVRQNYWIRLLGGMALEWKRTIYLLAASAYTWWDYLITSSVGQFGWLEAALPLWFAIGTYLLMVLFSVWSQGDQRTYAIKGKTRIALWIIFVILCAFTVMAMVNHTIMVTKYGSEAADGTYNIREALYEIPCIGGLQGRYFIPFAILPFLGLPRIKGLPAGKNTDGVKAWIVVGYQIIALIFTIVILLKRYWIG